MVAHAPLMCRTSILPHDLPFRSSAFIYRCLSTAAPSPPSPWFPFVAALGVLRFEALPALLRLAPVSSRREAVCRVDDPPVPVPTLLSRPRP